MKHRIFVLSNSISGGGAERASNLVANLLSGNGHKVFVQTIKSSNHDLIQLKVDHSCINLGKSRNPISIVKAIAKLQESIEKFNPTHIIVNCELPELLASFIRTKSKFIVVEHTTKPWLFFPLIGRLVRVALKLKRAKWVSVSSGQAIWMGPKSPDYIIPNLVYSSAQILEVSREDCPISRIVFIGRFANEKNPMAICEIGANLNLPLLFVGDGILREPIRQKCQDLGLNFTIESFLPNPWSLINPGDVVVVPSLWEGDGLVVLEALQLGVPILVSDIEDLRRLNLPEKNYFEDLTSCEDKIRANLFSASYLSVSTKNASKILENRSPQHIYDLWAACLSDA